MRYGGRAVKKLFVYCIWMVSGKTAKQMCGSRLSSVFGSRTEAIQKSRKKHRARWLSSNHKNQRNAAGHNEKVGVPAPVKSVQEFDIK